MFNLLQVCYDSYCSTALFTQELVSSVRNVRPGLSIEIVDLNKPDSQVPESIIAIPAYFLNGSTVFMGNPTLQALIERLDAD